MIGRLSHRCSALLALAAFAMAVAGSGATPALAKHKKTHKAAAQTTAPKTDPPASTPAKGPEAGSASAAAPAAAGTAPAASAKAANVWSDAEIADARAHCAVVLQRIHAVAIAHAPIREGACGAPAPVELVSIGTNPEVALSPPAIVRCDLAEELVHWFEKDVQPLALKHLKSPIVRIETMSSYSCRNAYGRKTTKLSEHGLANALDIGGFITASAATAEVLDDWGKPQREIAEEAEAQKKAAEAAATKVAEASVAGNPSQGATPSPLPSSAGAAVAGLARATIIDGVADANAAKARSFGDVNHLGGPAAKPAKAGAPLSKRTFFAARSIDNPDPEMKAFLHEAHESACKIFGTTLGPEANAAHRNHFHVDMAPRKFTKICD